MLGRYQVSLRLDVEEAMYLLDALDCWVDGYKETAEEAESSEEIERLMDQMSIGQSVRNKLWRRIKRKGWQFV